MPLEQLIASLPPEILKEDSYFCDEDDKNEEMSTEVKKMNVQDGEGNDGEARRDTSLERDTTTLNVEEQPRRRRRLALHYSPLFHPQIPYFIVVNLCGTSLTNIHVHVHVESNLVL